MNKKFSFKDVKEPSMVEGKTYLAEIVICPWAYRKIKDYESTAGKLVKVTLGEVVNIEWESGDRNSVPRKNIRIIGEYKPGDSQKNA